MPSINVLIYEPYPFAQVAGNLRTQSYIMELVNKERFHLILLAPLASDFTRKMLNDGIDAVILEPPKRVNRYGGKCLRDGYGGRYILLK